MRGCMLILNDYGIHTGNDLDLVQEIKEIGNPEIQTYNVEIPGRNGKLRLTKNLTGRVTYFNRKIKLQYLSSGSRADLQVIKDLLSKYHGEVIRIIDDDTPDYYYEGECSVENVDKGSYVQSVLTIDADPFRIMIEPIVRTITLSAETQTVYITNDGVAIVPTFTTTGTATIIIGDHTISVSTATTWEDPDVLLEPGLNKITVSGSGTLKISYKEARI